MRKVSVPETVQDCIGLAIRDWRGGMNQIKAAELLQISQASLSRVERGVGGLRFATVMALDKLDRQFILARAMKYRASLGAVLALLLLGGCGTQTAVQEGPFCSVYATLERCPALLLCEDAAGRYWTAGGAWEDDCAWEDCWGLLPDQQASLEDECGQLGMP